MDISQCIQKTKKGTICSRKKKIGNYCTAHAKMNDPDSVSSSDKSNSKSNILCKAQTKANKPCGNHPIKNSEFCGKHTAKDSKPVVSVTTIESIPVIDTYKVSDRLSNKECDDGATTELDDGDGNSVTSITD